MRETELCGAFSSPRSPWATRFPTFLLILTLLNLNRDSRSLAMTQNPPLPYLPDNASLSTLA